jgi:hypothetical protein
VFPVRYKLDSYILFRRYSVFKELIDEIRVIYKKDLVCILSKFTVLVYLGVCNDAFSNSRLCIINCDD